MAKVTRVETSQLVDEFYRFLHDEGGLPPSQLLAKTTSTEQRNELERYMLLVSKIEGLGQLSQLEFPEEEQSISEDDGDPDISFSAHRHLSQKMASATHSH